MSHRGDTVAWIGDRVQELGKNCVRHRLHYINIYLG
jgi:hypothetical protein